ncbi:MAG: hypothetical protein B7Z76_14220 [Acidiphilium sp. 20-67-58]|uniref:hypothetical protein n=1 Tax=Acidiphilium sp. 20-67-58 TaxID=1970291 RepID=UPI000BCE3D23|nr:hypothetical protein [Acidiphilium sp. 20-67-58]OYV54527.1 MAG: hypothetical protein B7Z76_14220 [Acidiphilium sp. 20-67-58]
MANEKALTAIAADLDLCDLGLVLTTGSRRRTFASHRKACFDALKAMNAAEGLDQISDDDLLAELLS